jgi:hypothetical protein
VNGAGPFYGVQSHQLMLLASGAGQGIGSLRNDGMAPLRMSGIRCPLPDVTLHIEVGGLYTYHPGKKHLLE